VSWFILKFSPDRYVSLLVVGFGNMIYLLAGYWVYSTENYDIDWTVAQV